MRRVARTLTPDEADSIVAAYEFGLTLREGDELFGVDRGTITNAAKHAGLRTRYHQRAGIDLDRAELLHAQGLTISEVAEHLGIGRTTLVRARRENR